MEDIVYNSVNYIDEEATKQLIEKYKQDNSKEIVINQFRRKEELKGESISIKEREEEITAANMKFQVRFFHITLDCSVWKVTVLFKTDSHTEISPN